jgi:mRNA interferase RelE/StbE
VSADEEGRQVASEVCFTDDAIEDLRRIGPDAAAKVLKKIRLLETDAEAGYPLGGEVTRFRKLVVDRKTWRVVYRVAGQRKMVEICTIWVVGARRDAEVYAIAVTRVRDASMREPELVRLVGVVERLGRVAGHLATASSAQSSHARDPVPDWLAQRLIRIVGLRPEQVAAMDLEQAVERWTAYMIERNKAEE